MWVWCSETGALLNARRELRGYGYAGRGDGLNNPDLQHVKGVGPLPEATYTILSPHDSPVTGPYTLGLMPLAGSQVFGRSSFAIHGDRADGKREASHGCIVINRAQREAIWASGDHAIRVVAI